MNQRFKTYIYNTFDTEQVKKLDTSFNFVSNQLKVDTTTEIVDQLNIDLSSDNMLIILLDEMQLAKFNEDSNAQQFFQQPQFKNYQVIIIADDVLPEQLPAYFQYFPFFSLQGTNETYETENNQSEFQLSFIQVSYDILQYIKAISNTKSSKKTVFIGPADGKTQSEHQKIIRELLHRGYLIKPLIQNPSARSLIDENSELDTILNDSVLAIHFISHESLAQYPENSTASLEVNKQAANYCKNNKSISRIIFVPDETDETDELVSKKIIQFKSDMELLTNAELVQTPVEKLKNIVLTKLDQILFSGETKKSYSHHENELYFIYPPGELKNVEPYFDWLDKNKIAYSHSQIELDQLDLLEYHQEKLVNVRGVVIFNNGNERWLSRKLSDIKKAPGWGRTKPFDFKIICGEKLSEIQLNGENYGDLTLLNNPDKEKSEMLDLIKNKT